MRGFQKCWFGQGIPSKSNAKPLFGIHSLHKVTLFTISCDVSEPVLMNVLDFATSDPWDLFNVLAFATSDPCIRSRELQAGAAGVAAALL